MSYIAPAMQEKFHSLSTELQQEILKRDVSIHNLNDFIRCLETIVQGNHPFG